MYFLKINVIFTKWKLKRLCFLLSNGSSDIYKNNTLTHFTNKLPAPIDLQNENKYENCY
jgi:hypothetical protein